MNTAKWMRCSMCGRSASCGLQPNHCNAEVLKFLGPVHCDAMTSAGQPSIAALAWYMVSNSRVSGTSSLAWNASSSLRVANSLGAERPLLSDHYCVLQNMSFKKKIRYESRKQLAESRPRVKGQFVRADSLPQGSTGGCTLQNFPTDRLSWCGGASVHWGLPCRASDPAVQTSILPRASPSPPGQQRACIP